MVKVFRPNQTSSKNYQQTQGKLNGAHWNRTMRENCKNVFISQGPSTAESKQFTQLGYFKEILIKTLSKDVSGISRVGGEGWAGQLLESHQRELCGQSLWENQWLWQRDTHSQPAGRDYPEKTHSPPTASAARAPRWLNRMKAWG